MKIYGIQMIFFLDLTGHEPPDDIGDRGVQGSVKVDKAWLGAELIWVDCLGKLLQFLKNQMLHGCLAKAEIPKASQGKSSLSLPVLSVCKQQA